MALGPRLKDNRRRGSVVAPNSAPPNFRPQVDDGLSSNIVDFENFAAKPNPSAAMKGYIALSRLVSADGHLRIMVTIDSINVT